MENNLSIHIRLFNDKIRIMNQTNKKDLILTALEARNLHSEIYALLAQIAELSGQKQENDTVSVVMDGGGF